MAHPERGESKKKADDIIVREPGPSAMIPIAKGKAYSAIRPNRISHVGHPIPPLFPCIRTCPDIARSTRGDCDTSRSSHPSPTVWRMHVRPSSFSSKRRDEQLPERFAIVTRAHYVRSYISEPPSRVSRPRPGRGEGRVLRPPGQSQWHSGTSLPSIELRWDGEDEALRFLLLEIMFGARRTFSHGYLLINTKAYIE